jgi:hypothetical protein
MDTTFGSLDNRELTLRWISPFAFDRWTGRQWSFSWRELLRWRSWRCYLKALFNRESWRVGFKRFQRSTHRCWCPDGTMIDGECVLFGFGFIWFYSHYTGEIPCTCDKAIAELFPEEAHAQ